MVRLGTQTLIREMQVIIDVQCAELRAREQHVARTHKVRPDFKSGIRGKLRRRV
jgi:hypothetical protein